MRIRRGRVRGLPPAPDRRNFTFERWRKLTFVGAPRQPTRMVFDFVGTFDCVPDDGGTTIRHAYEFAFKGPFRVVERSLGDWLRAEIEVATIAEIVGGTGRAEESLGVGVQTVHPDVPEPPCDRRDRRRIRFALALDVDVDVDGHRSVLPSRIVQHVGDDDLDVGGRAVAHVRSPIRNACR